MKLEDIQRTIDALEEQLQKPFAVIMSPKNFDSLLNEMARQNLIIQKEPLMLSGLRIEAWPHFPEDSILCVTKDGYDKITAKPKMEDLIIFPTKLLEEKVVDCNVIPDKKKVLEWYEKLEELLKKEITMQEIRHDDSTGKSFVEDTIEELVPHIKKSLESPDVKYVKIFRGSALGKDGKKFIHAEEEKKGILDKIADQGVKE